MGHQSLRGLASVLTWDGEAKHPWNGSGLSGIPEGNKSVDNPNEVWAVYAYQTTLSFAPSQGGRPLVYLP